MITNTVRRARKYHPCEAYGEHYIRPGHRYIDSRLSPDEDASGGVWCRMACCRRCAERYQLGHLFGPIVTVQTLAEARAEAERYPAQSCVYCDECGLTHCGDYIVSDLDDKPTRLGYARAHLSREGWSCDERGDFCPEHKPTAAELVVDAEIVDATA